MKKLILIALAALFSMGMEAQTLQLDSVYEVNVTDSAKTIVSWLLEHDNGFKGKEKSMNRIFRDRYSRDPIYMAKVIAPTSFGSFMPGSVSSIFNVPSINGEPPVYRGNLQVVDGRWGIYWEGLSYQKQPIVWIVDGMYSMTTGYHKRWKQVRDKVLEQYKDTDPEFYAFANSHKSIRQILDSPSNEYPFFAYQVSNLWMSDDIEPLYKYFISELSIFDAKPLIIYITTKS